MRLTKPKMPFDNKEYVENPNPNGEPEEIKYSWLFEGDTIYYTLQKLLNKLGQLEDIEGELGIDLVTLFKALKNGAYVKMYDYISFQRVGIDENAQLRTFSFSQTYGVQLDYFLDFKDYGKTWALTKEELE